jgi:hypothetical protein
MRRIAVVLMLCSSMWLQAQAAPRVLRVGVTPTADEEVRAGLAFGIEEARRSMALFGWRVQIDTVHAGVAPGSRIHAVVSTEPVDGTGDIPVLMLSCAPAPRAFLLSDCPVSDAIEWHPTLERFGAGQVNDRYRAATGRGMSAAAWRAWFAMKVLSETAMRARDPARIAERLRNPATQFDGHKGTALRFDERGVLRQPLYRVTRDSSGVETARETGARP